MTRTSHEVAHHIGALASYGCTCTFCSPAARNCSPTHACVAAAEGNPVTRPQTRSPAARLCFEKPTIVSRSRRILRAREIAEPLFAAGHAHAPVA